MKKNDWKTDDKEIEYRRTHASDDWVYYIMWLIVGIMVGMVLSLITQAL